MRTWRWPDSQDVTDWEELANLAVALKNEWIDHLRGRLVLAHYASIHEAESDVASILGCTTERVKLYALMFAGLASRTAEGEIRWVRMHADTPFGVYSACADAAGRDPDEEKFTARFLEALEWALAHEASPREIRDEFGIGKWEKTAEPWVNSGALVLAQQGRKIGFEVEEEPEGEAPRRVKLRATPDEEERDGHREST